MSDADRYIEDYDLPEDDGFYQEAPSLKAPRRPNKNLYYEDIEAKVLKFDPRTGDARLELDDSWRSEALLPRETLHEFGYKTVSHNLVIFCEICPSDAGLIATKIHYIDFPPGKFEPKQKFLHKTAEARRPDPSPERFSADKIPASVPGVRSSFPAQRKRPSAEPSDFKADIEIGAEIVGSIRFVDPAKGFGFLVPDEPMKKDVFIHSNVFKEAGLVSPEKGMRAKVVTKMGRKGPEAERIEMLPQQ